MKKWVTLVNFRLPLFYFPRFQCAWCSLRNETGLMYTCEYYYSLFCLSYVDSNDLGKIRWNRLARFAFFNSFLDCQKLYSIISIANVPLFLHSIHQYKMALYTLCKRNYITFFIKYISINEYDPQFDISLRSLIYISNCFCKTHQLSLIDNVYALLNFKKHYDIFKIW